MPDRTRRSDRHLSPPPRGDPAALASTEFAIPSHTARPLRCVALDTPADRLLQSVVGALWRRRMPRWSAAAKVRARPALPARPNHCNTPAHRVSRRARVMHRASVHRSKVSICCSCRSRHEGLQKNLAATWPAGGAREAFGSARMSGSVPCLCARERVCAAAESVARAGGPSG